MKAEIMSQIPVNKTIHAGTLESFRLVSPVIRKMIPTTRKFARFAPLDPEIPGIRTETINQIAKMRVIHPFTVMDDHLPV
ncbi:hypothetical protein LA10_02737 [Thermotoga neapolitana LA10]|nr:hypothetical protein LA10_02737 [Thermotoga neapolitana LA10]